MIKNCFLKSGDIASQLLNELKSICITAYGFELPAGGLHVVAYEWLKPGHTLSEVEHVLKKYVSMDMEV